MKHTLLALLLTVLLSKSTFAKQPNIVFFFADDQTTSTLGCYGNDVIKTPNIDGLARRGTRFSNAFVSHSICWVSRTTILSGLTRSLGTHGLRRATVITWHRFHERFCDWRLGIETAKPIALKADESSHDYEATDYPLLKRMFCELRHRAPDVVLLDYGCGKGRAANHN